MNIINAENLTKSYTERKLLDKASFYLQEGEKVGVIGINGTVFTLVLALSQNPITVISSFLTHGELSFQKKRDRLALLS